MFFRIISILLMQKQIPLCLLAIVLSVSLFGQNLKADKIILSDSDLTNLYQIDSGVYRSEQPSKEGFKNSFYLMMFILSFRFDVQIHLCRVT